MTPVWRFAFFAALGSITVLAFLPDYSALPPIVSVSDLANHAAAFTVLFLLYSLSYAHSHKRIFLTLLAYGAFIEIVQGFLPTRYASLEDIAADSVGLMIALLIRKSIGARLSTPKGQEN